MTEPNEELRFEDQNPVLPISHERNQDRLESLLQRTESSFANEGMFEKLVDFVYTERLPSQFSFENLSELVRYLLGQNDLLSKLDEPEECISWVTTSLYEDPKAHKQTRRLWDSVIYNIQNK